MYGLKDDILNKIKNIQQSNKITILLFGSRARGNYKDNSDIDIAIMDNVTESQKYKILDEFEQIDVEYKIDVVFIQQITNIKFKENIMKEGKKI